VEKNLVVAYNVEGIFLLAMNQLHNRAFQERKNENRILRVTVDVIHDE
jgi:hypothetical protein